MIDVLLKKIQEIFPQADADAMLEKFESQTYPEKERVALAILKLCEERGYDSPDGLIGVAQGDFRDVLMWAEYPNEMYVQSWKEPADKVKKVQKKDKDQYLDWLNK